MKPGILALDPSAKAIGWAVSAWSLKPEILASGAFRPLSDPDRAQDEDVRHALMCGRALVWLEELVNVHHPGVLVVEHGGGNFTDRCSERLRGALMATGHASHMAVKLVRPVTWQSWARRDHGWYKSMKSDEQDAREILWWALHELDIQT